MAMSRDVLLSLVANNMASPAFMKVAGDVDVLLQKNADLQAKLGATSVAFTNLGVATDKYQSGVLNLSTAYDRLFTANDAVTKATYAYNVALSGIADKANMTRAEINALATATRELKTAMSAQLSGENLVTRVSQQVSAAEAQLVGGQARASATVNRQQAAQYATTVANMQAADATAHKQALASHIYTNAAGGLGIVRPDPSIAAGAKQFGNAATWQAFTQTPAFDASIGVPKTVAGQQAIIQHQQDAYTQFQVQRQNASQLVSDTQAQLNNAVSFANEQHEQLGLAGSSPDFVVQDLAQWDAAHPSQATVAKKHAAQVAQTEAEKKKKQGDGMSGGGLMTFLKYGVGYQLGYMLMGGIGSSLQRAQAYSTGMGTQKGATALSEADVAALDTMTTKDVSQVGLPFNRNVLQAGAYSLASIGVGTDPRTGKADVNAINTINMLAAKMAAAGGDTTTSAESNALTTAGGAYGVLKMKPQDQATWFKNTADSMQMAVNIAKAPVGVFATQMGAPMATASQLGVSTSDVMTMLAMESVGGVSSGQLGNDLNSALAGFTRKAPSARQKALAASRGLAIGPDFWTKYGGMQGGLEQLQIATATSKTFSNADREQFIAEFTGNSASAHSLNAVLQQNYGAAFGAIAGAPTVGGVGQLQTSFAGSQKYAGNQVADAMAKFQTNLDTLTTNLLPIEARLVGSLGDLAGAVDDLVKGPLGKGGLGASIQGAGDTLFHLTNSRDKGYMNIDVARNEAAQDISGHPKTVVAPKSSRNAIANVDSFFQDLGSSLGYGLIPGLNFAGDSGDLPFWQAHTAPHTQAAPKKASSSYIPAHWGPTVIASGGAQTQSWIPASGTPPERTLPWYANLMSAHAAHRDDFSSATTTPVRTFTAQQDAITRGIMGYPGRGNTGGIYSQDVNSLKDAMNTLMKAGKDSGFTINNRGALITDLAKMHELLASQQLDHKMTPQEQGLFRATQGTVGKYLTNVSGEHNTQLVDALTHQADSAKLTYDGAVLMGATPAKLKATFDAYLLAQERVLNAQYSGKGAKQDITYTNKMTGLIQTGIAFDNSQVKDLTGDYQTKLQMADRTGDPAKIKAAQDALVKYQKSQRADPLALQAEVLGFTDAATQKVAQGMMDQITLDRAKKSPALAGDVAKYEKYAAGHREALGQTATQQAATNFGFTQGAAQEALTALDKKVQIAQITGIGLRSAQDAVLRDMTQNMAALGITPDDIKLLRAQYAQAYKPTPGPTYVRPNQVSDGIDATFGGAIARIAKAHDPMESMDKTLEKELAESRQNGAKLAQQVIAQQQMIRRLDTIIAQGNRGGGSTTPKTGGTHARQIAR